MAKDIYHELVRTILEQAGWLITHDPFRLKYRGLKLEIDLGAEQVLGAERNGQKIAVEIKSFINPSVLYDFHLALGQFRTYKRILAKQEPERQLYLGVELNIYESFFAQPFGQEAVEEEELRLLIFDAEQRSLVAWIKPHTTEP